MPQLAVVVILSGASLGAQTAEPGPPSSSRLLSRLDYRLDVVNFLTDDERFSWAADMGFDADLWDFGPGRVAAVGELEVVLDDVVDPAQDNYVLELSANARLPRRAEIGVVLHHVSRHLVDRANRHRVSWNLLGTRLVKRVELGRSTLDGRIDAGFVVAARSFVDYAWQAGGAARWIRRGARRWSPVASGELVLRGVHRDERLRDTQVGARGEAGVRLTGRRADLELFVAYERRIDPYPVSFGSARWALLGARVISR